jgi:hypothetical protein
MVSVLLASPLAACADWPLAAANSRPSGGAIVSFAPVFAAANDVPPAVAAAPFDGDRVRIVIVRPPRDTLADTTLMFPAGQAELALHLDVQAAPGEAVDATIQLRAVNTVLYEGTGRVTVRRRDDTSGPPASIAMLPVAPGSAALAVFVTPATGVFSNASPVTFTARATGAGGADIAGALFAWSVDNQAIGSIDDAGRVTPSQMGGALRVRATTINGTFGEAAVSIMGPPASIAVLVGNGQVGPAGTTLPSALVVEVKDTFGNLLPGIPVSWSVTGGSATIVGAPNTTDVNGRASAQVALGGVLGAVTVRATVGSLSADFGATIVTGAPAVLSLVSGGGQSAIVASSLSAPIAVRVTDQFNNPVAGDNVGFAVATGGGTVAVLNGTTDAGGVAQAQWTLGLVVGTQTLTATRAGLTGSPLAIAASATPGPTVGGSWNGTYDWTCAGGGSVPIQFTLVQAPTQSTFTGTVTYRGSTAPITGARFDVLTQGGRAVGVTLSSPSPTGPFVSLVWGSAATFVNNEFVGTLAGNSLSGSTLNGESMTGIVGCSEVIGPSGSFAIQR